MHDSDRVRVRLGVWVRARNMVRVRVGVSGRVRNWVRVMVIAARLGLGLGLGLARSSHRSPPK